MAALLPPPRVLRRRFRPRARHPGGVRGVWGRVGLVWPSRRDRALWAWRATALAAGPVRPGRSSPGHDGVTPEYLEHTRRRFARRATASTIQKPDANDTRMSVSAIASARVSPVIP